MTLKEIAQSLNGQLYGPEDLEIKGPAKIEEAQAGEITFIANPKYRQYLPTTKASAVILDAYVDDVEISQIVVANSYVGFLILLKMFSPVAHDYISGVSDKAFVDDSASVDPSASIAALAYIGPNVTIGKKCIIYPGVVLLKDVHVGDECILYPNVSVREQCTIGSRVILHNGCVIGSDGFGFAPRNGVYIKIPQIGNVVIEDDVEIGANTTIDRATLGSTVVKKGSKLDNLVQLAHNVVVGENNAIAAQAGVAGSAILGSNVTVGGQVGITGHIKVSDHVMIAAQSGVSKDAPEKSILFGSPAMPIAKQKRVEASLRRLPEIVKRVRELEKELTDLKSQLAEDNERSLNG